MAKRSLEGWGFRGAKGSRLPLGQQRQVEGETGSADDQYAAGASRSSSSSRSGRPGRRRLAKEARRAAHLAEQLAYAGDDPKANAEVSFDRLRTAIKALPPARRANAWHLVRAELDGIRENLQSRST